MSRRLLLVDDEDAIRQISGLSLEVVGGWDVVAVASGQRALAAAAAEDRDEVDGSFEAVLLDVMMPGLDGPATLRALRKGDLPAHVPVIFLTAKVQRGEREALIAAGAAGVIAKPFDPMMLPTQVQEIIAATAVAVTAS